jgi:hypothetical protein
MTEEQIIRLVIPLLPTLILILGGQVVLNLYARQKSRREKELELLRAMRENQYSIIQDLYSTFAQFMKLYRLTAPKTNITNLEDRDTRGRLLEQAIEAESRIDALIIRAGVEFGADGEDKDKGRQLSALLGNLRQSVQVWRESFRQGNTLPFNRADQEDYLRFKQCFVYTACFLTQRYFSQLEKPRINQRMAWSIVLDAFANKYEVKEKYRSILE